MKIENQSKSIKIKHSLAKEVHRHSYRINKIISKISMSESEAKGLKKNLIFYLSLDNDDYKLDNRFKKKLIY